MNKYSVGLIVSIVAFCLAVIFCLTLPDNVALIVDFNSAVSYVGTKWLILVYPISQIVLAMICTINSKIIDNKSISLFLIFAQYALLYFLVLELELASQNFALGEQTNMPIMSFVFFPICILLFVAREKITSCISADYKRGYLYNKIANAIVVVVGLLILVLCITNFFLNINTLLVIVATIALAVAVILVIILKIVYNKE